MKPLARAGIRLGIHLLRSLPKGISGAEGRQLLSDALVIGAALAPHAPASVAPVLAGVLGWAGSAVVAPPVSADEALADMLEAVEAAIGAESAAPIVCDLLRSWYRQSPKQVPCRSGGAAD